MDASDAQIRAQREAFIKSFQDIAKATANLHAITIKQIELMNNTIDSIDGLAGTLVAPKDGLRDVLDELIDEIRGLREDIRIVARGVGAQAVYAALTGAAQRRTKG